MPRPYNVVNATTPPHPKPQITMEKHLRVDEFFVRLTELFDSRRKEDHGSIFLTQKRLTYGEPPETFPEPTEEAPFPDLKPTKPLSILIRATDGKRTKQNRRKTTISTIVTPDAIEGFFVRYGEVCKLGMSGLKKRDKKKMKEKLKAKKRQKEGVMAEDIEKKP